MFFLGLDIAKLTFEVCLLDYEGKTLARSSFKRTLDGMGQLLAWTKTHTKNFDVWAHMEATGDLWLMPARFLNDAGFKVSVLNPQRIHHFAKSLMRRHKNDVLDAHLLALYGHRMRPELWKAIEPLRFEFRALMRRIRQLTLMRNQEKNRLSSLELSRLESESLERMLEMLGREQEQLWEQAWVMVESDQALKKEIELVSSIKGIGRKTAAQLMGEILSLERFENAKKISCWAGLIPSEFSSGTSVKKEDELCAQGCRPIRYVLYMPALSAMRYNEPIKCLVERLKDRGKTGKERIVAAMHKLLRQVYGVLNSGQPFDERRSLST